MDNTEKLKIGLIEPDDKVAKDIKKFFEKQNDIELVEIFKSKYDELKQKLENGDFNTLIVNIFDYSDGVEIINFISEEKKPVPVCLLGKKEELIDLSRFDKSSIRDLRDYCKLETNSDNLDLRVLDMSKQLLHCKKSQKSKDEVRKEIKMEVGKFILGLNVNKLNDIINDTLKETSETIRHYKWVNTGIIIFGGLLIIGTIICYILSSIGKLNAGSSEFLTFGGLGLAGIIASLITNPTSSINKTARQRIQIQIAYFSFLKQIEILNKVAVSDMKTAKEQSDCLENATRSLQETLSKYFDEHKKGKDKKEDED